MRGLGQSQIQAREKSKQKLIDFIKNYQPCTSNQIRKNSKIRRNNIRQFLYELTDKEKIIQIKNHYFINPPSKTEIEKLEKLDTALTLLSTLQKNNSKSIELVQKHLRFIRKQPLRANLIYKKMSPTVIKEANSLFELNYKKKLSIKDIKVYLKIFIKLEKSLLIFLDEFLIWYWIYRRFEFPRYRDPYTNPHGIEPRFLKNGNLNMQKIEEEYEKNIESGCCLCGCGLYIENVFNNYATCQKLFEQGKISQSENEQRLKSIKKERTVWRKVKIPNGKIDLEKIENSNMDIFQHIDQTMGQLLRSNVSLYL